MAKREKDWTTKNTIKWKRKSSGHYEMYAWYIWKEPEVHAEIFKEKSKWKYRLWSWGTANPEPLASSYEEFKNAKEVKARVIELILEGEPHIRSKRCH